MQSRLLVCVWLAVCVVTLGCQAMMYGTAQQLNKISVGMTRSEVVDNLGNPDSTAAQGDAEFLIYRWMEAVISDWPKEYFVKLENGRVISFGRKGDFDLTKDPTVNVNMDENVSVQHKREPSNEGNLNKYEQLEKLHTLKHKGIITDDEYLREKERIMSEK